MFQVIKSTMMLPRFCFDAIAELLLACEVGGRDRLGSCASGAIGHSQAGRLHGLGAVLRLINTAVPGNNIQ